MPHSLLLLQLVVIIATARLLALGLRRLGQPPVIGEMVAGIVLGPMVFGTLAPEWQAALFAPGSLAPLKGLAELGLVLFMFIVGAEIRLPGGGLKGPLRNAALVGSLSVVVPMALGLAISPALYPTLAPEGVGFWAFALFMAAAMAITAFPIMARILKERGMTHSVVGQLSLTSAAFADILAWIALGVVVVLIAADAHPGSVAKMVLGLVGLVALLFGLLRGWLARAIARHSEDGRPTAPLLAMLLLGAFASAAFTEWLGLHAVFGAFVFGCALPRDNRLLASLIERIEHMAVIVLMPVFFALAGLNTTPDALAGGGAMALGLILFAAIAGKIIGSAAGARIAGFDWRTCLAVGSLMNARALMELIVMRVGLDVGVIGQEAFTLLLVMAVVTTMMTGPLLAFFTRPRAGEAPARGVAPPP